MDSVRYTIHASRAIRLRPWLAPDRAGLYAVLLNHRTALDGAFANAGLELPPASHGTRPILYIGATSDSLRRRLTSHTRRDSRTSNLRMTLGALLTLELGLRGQPTPNKRYYDFGVAGEARLTAWMDEHLSIGLRPTQNPHLHERRLIERQRPLLNIQFQHRSPLARGLLSLRRACAERCPPPPAEVLA